MQKKDRNILLPPSESKEEMSTQNILEKQRYA